MLRIACTSAVVLTCASCSGQTPSAAPVAAVGMSAAADAPDGHSTGAHGDHVPRHGGIVFMNGDLHFEVVLSRSGTHQIYFSDETRAELPAATVSEVTLSFSSGEAPAETLRAEVDDSGESWIAKGSPLNGKGRHGTRVLHRGERAVLDRRSVHRSRRQRTVHGHEVGRSRGARCCVCLFSCTRLG